MENTCNFHGSKYMYDTVILMVAVDIEEEEEEEECIGYF